MADPSVPSDLRQFQFRHLVWMALSVCVAAGLIRWNSEFGWRLLIAVACFWAELGLMFVSDVLDPRVINDRKILSKLLSALGALMTALSSIFIGFLILNLVFASIQYFRGGV